MNTLSTKLLLLIIILAITLPIQAQTNWTKEGVIAMMDDYIQLTKEGNYDKSFDYVHPSVFDLVSKEMMINAFEGIMKDTTMKLTMGEFALQKVGDLVLYKNINYAIVNYSSAITIELIGKDEPDFQELLLGVYQAKFGDENVQLDKATNTFSIVQQKRLFAIGDPNIGSWKMLEDEAGMEDILGDVVPKKVKKKLN